MNGLDTYEARHHTFRACLLESGAFPTGEGDWWRISRAYEEPDSPAVLQVKDFDLVTWEQVKAVARAKELVGSDVSDTERCFGCFRAYWGVSPAEHTCGGEQ